ncbi:MAG: hypothetical protein GEU88_19435 [Solirubrobacterales bacterium]|nr:hypothetical protein [Solirubrobacterales bacterium]
MPGADRGRARPEPSTRPVAHRHATGRVLRGPAPRGHRGRRRGQGRRRGKRGRARLRERRDLGGRGHQARRPDGRRATRREL